MRAGSRKQFINNFVFPTWAFAAGFNKKFVFVLEILNFFHLEMELVTAQTSQ